MTYFKILALVYGLAAFLKPFYMHLLPWDENRFLARAYAEERPTWVVPVVVAGFALVALTWYIELTTSVPYSIVITLLFSLTAIKGAILLYDYPRFQRWVAGMLRRDGGRQIVAIDIGVAVFGLAILLAAFLLF